MITADLDRELAASLRSLIARGGLPATTAQLAIRGTWRPAPDGAPARYATTLPLELAALAGTDPAPIAAGLARPLGAAGWIEEAGSSGGYLIDHGDAAGTGTLGGADGGGRAGLRGQRDPGRHHHHGGGLA